MNFDKLEHAIISYRESLARFRDDREALCALGVTDLPGDEPRCLGTHTQPGFPVLPWKPSWEMTAAVRKTLEANGYLIPDGPVETALSAAAAVAPKPAPGNLPGEPTNEMLRCAVDTARDVGEPVQAGTMHAALSAALAAAPKPAPAPAPGSLPLEPTDEMVEAGRCRDGDGDAYGAGMVREILRAALAAAPRVEVPEVTEEDVMAYRDARNKAEKVEERYENAQLIALAAVRSRLIARMGAKS